MRLLVLLSLVLFLALPGQAQERVRNVRVRVADSSQLEIQYDLINARPGDSVYLEVRSRLRGLLRILPEFVRGDIGKRIVAGSDRRIVWNALANGYSLNEEIRATVAVKAGLPAELQSPDPLVKTETSRPETTPAPKQPVAVAPAEDRPKTVDLPAPSGKPATQPAQTVKPSTNIPDSAPVETTVQKTRYAGPAWALLSVVAPGVGNIFVQTPRPRIGLRPVLAVGCYTLLLYGLQERQKSRDVYAVYLGQKNAETADAYYQTANAHHHRYFLATRGAVVVAAADVILTFFKGMRNVQTQQANRRLQPVSLRPGLQAGQPTAVVRYTF